MADDTRQPLPDLTEPSLPSFDGYDFFQLLRRLEEARGQVFGRAGLPAQEPARLGQQVRLGFAVQDVASVSAPADGEQPRVTVANIGLLGPEGPMPLYLTRWILDRVSQRWFAGADMLEVSDTTFIDFANVLQHRMIALFYRAWADAHPAVQAERTDGGRVRAMAAAMAGLGLVARGDGPPDEIERAKLAHAPALAMQVDSPEKLTDFLADLLQVPVQLKEFIGAWIEIPAKLQSRLGGAHMQLGRSATIGPRTFQRQQRAEVVLGPLSLTQYESFLPDRPARHRLQNAILDILGHGIDIDVRLVLRRDEVPPARLGEARLGQVAWVARPVSRGDADDLCIRALVGWKPDDQEAA